LLGASSPRCGPRPDLTDQPTAIKPGTEAETPGYAGPPTRRPQISNDQDQLQEKGSRQGLRRSHDDDDDDGNRDGERNTLARTLGIPNSA